MRDRWIFESNPSREPGTKAVAKETVDPKVPPMVDNPDPNEPKLTKALMRRLHYVHTERKRLETEARQLKKEEDMLRDVAFSWLEGRGVKSVTKFGFRLAQKYGRVVVPWQQAFIRLLGSDKAKELTASSPKSISLEIEAVEATE